MLKLDFVPEWIGVALIAALDTVWGAKIGFHLSIAWRDARIPGAVLLAMLALHAANRRRLGAMAEYFALTLVAVAAFGVSSYLSLASAGPLADGALAAADRALGFDWLRGFQLFNAYPLIAGALRLLYDSMPYQVLYFALLLGLMGRRQQMRELFWIVFVAGLLTDIGAMLLPALGPFKTFGLESRGGFLPDMQRLIDGRDLHFALSRMTGVVSFPSFHTVMALAYAWGFRRTGAVGWILAGANLLMLPAIPFVGGHYLIDMIAGAGVFGVSLLMVRQVMWRGSGRQDDPFEEIAAPIEELA